MSAEQAVLLAQSPEYITSETATALPNVFSTVPTRRLNCWSAVSALIQRIVCASPSSRHRRGTRHQTSWGIEIHGIAILCGSQMAQYLGFQ
jgi:hypothetical protein